MSRVTISAFLFMLLSVCSLKAEICALSSNSIDTRIIDDDQTQLLLDYAAQQIGMDNAAGVRYATLALSNAIRLADPEFEARSQLLLGQFSMDIGLFATSLDHINKAIDLSS